MYNITTLESDFSGTTGSSSTITTLKLNNSHQTRYPLDCLMAYWGLRGNVEDQF